MDGDQAETASPTYWARLRRPVGPVENLRWLFFLSVVASLVLTLPGLLTAASAPAALLLLSGSAVLVGCWSYRYLTRTTPLLLDVIEVVAVAMVAVASPDVAAVFRFSVATLWFRALYGSLRRILLFFVLSAGAVTLALPLWGMLPDREGLASTMVVLLMLPVLLLTVAVARHLALGVSAREQAQERDAALVRLGTGLIGVGDREQLEQRARECAEAICAATPGLRALIITARDGDPRVLGYAGQFDRVPETLPATVLPSDAGAGVAQQLRDTLPLAEAAGFDTEWLAVPLLEETGGWIVIGAPTRIPPDSIVAVRSMANQVALALHSSASIDDLTTQAHADALTGLANRTAFTTALELALSVPGISPVLLLLDLDGFKAVNDGLGHAAGDELLRQVAVRLRDALRPDDLCARLGGDEFAVLLIDPGAAETVATRLIELAAEPVSLKGRTVHVGASVGLAFATPGTSAEQLLKCADVAGYAAKSKGRNRVEIFTPGLLLDDGRAAFEAELAGAAGAGQLVVHYQPIVSIPELRCIAVEALVRWQHPTRGLLPPSEFIAIAERTGAIMGVGAFVLRRACMDAEHWAGSSGRLAVHVNVSAAQLIDPDFLGEVQGCVADFAIEPGQLVLEITESMVLDSPAIRAALDALSAMDVAIAIDDFGTGYSALSTLRTLPLNIVKIDKSFLVGGPSRAAAEVVVEAIVQMAGRLGLQIVAEGVERVEQQQFLAGVGADAAQGYLHLRPTSAAEFGNWLRRREALPEEGGTVTSLVPRRTG